MNVPVPGNTSVQVQTKRTICVVRKEVARLMIVTVKYLGTQRYVMENGLVALDKVVVDVIHPMFINHVVLVSIVQVVGVMVTMTTTNHLHLPKPPILWEEFGKIKMVTIHMMIMLRRLGAGHRLLMPV